MPSTSKKYGKVIKELQDSIRERSRYSLAKEWKHLGKQELFEVTALTVRDRMVDRMLEAQAHFDAEDAKKVYYLSLEFLMGRLLTNNLANLELEDQCRAALQAMGADLEEIREHEPDAALGNGGLGRLAACFLDSMATLDIPGYGYGINYEYGLFRQVIEDGYQVERPDNWLTLGTPWQIIRQDETCVIPVYGHIEEGVARDGSYNPMWMEWKVLIGVPHDMPIVGYGGRTVNYLRLYSARSSHEFDMEIFNEGDYVRAVEQKLQSENITKVLYPSDSVTAGRELRLLQEYFLVACSLRDILRRYQSKHTGFAQFSRKIAIQLNDTHPTLAVAELMRILVDEEDVPWDEAWEVTRQTLGYTNHTLLPEALERWPVSLMARVIPRHLQIIFEINRRFLDEVSSRWPGDGDRMSRMSIIEEGGEKQVRMAHLGIVGSHSVNGVSVVHTELVKSSLVPDFYEMWPDRFNNKTNGVTQRRWLAQANPGLAELITARSGAGWISDLDQIRQIEILAEDTGFQDEFAAVKRQNKARLARLIQEVTHVVVDPSSLFDVHVKRIHEYKRQLLNVMHIIYEYLALVEDGMAPPAPRTYLFAGKAAPGYWAAKEIIKLINNVGHVINADPRARDFMRVVFLPDYRVTLAETIIPAADLSEQISTAGKEASGTSNMKFAMNGALTIGTLDGANIEIREEVGEENIFIFGLTVSQIKSIRSIGSYDPRNCLADPRVRRVMDALNSSRFCPREPGLFGWIYQSLLATGDEYFHLADLGPYLDVHQRVGQEFLCASCWTRKAILNVARSGKFSSDRTIREYAREIWGLPEGATERSDP